MRWRSIRLLPRKACATIRTLKCVSPPGRAPACPACRWDSSVTSRRSGAKAFVNFSAMTSRVVIRGVIPVVMRPVCTIFMEQRNEAVKSGFRSGNVKMPVRRECYMTNEGESCAYLNAAAAPEPLDPICQGLKVDAPRPHNGSSMKTDSPLFDSIRVKPDKDRRPRGELPGCEWPSCNAAATHRAPKGRQRENEYWRFFLRPVWQYKHPHTFFARMRDEAIY